jgi:hypothetical protein
MSIRQMEYVDYEKSARKPQQLLRRNINSD